MQVDYVFTDENNRENLANAVFTALKEDFDSQSQPLHRLLPSEEISKHGLNPNTSVSPEYHFWHNRTIIEGSFESSQVLVCLTSEQEVVGFVTWNKSSLVLEVDIINVLPKYQNQGFGTAMIKNLVQNHLDIYVLTTRSTEQACGFFNRLEWTRSPAEQCFYKIIRPGVPRDNSLPDGLVMAICKADFYDVLDAPDKYRDQMQWFQIKLETHQKLAIPIITPIQHEGYICIYINQRVVAKGKLKHLFQDGHLLDMGNGILAMNNFEPIDKLKKIMDYYPGLTTTGLRLKRKREAEGIGTSKADMLGFFSSNECKLIRYPSFKECLVDEHKLKYLRKGFYGLLDDARDTTDEDSSDDDSDKEILLNEQLAVNSQRKKCFRGIHFGPNHFTSRQRKEAQLPDHHQHDEYSLGTKELSKTSNLQNADGAIKQQFLALRDDTNITRERNASGGLAAPRKANNNAIQFQNRYHHLVHVYVNQHGYKKLFQDGGISRNFGFPNTVTKNIFLSTTTDEKVAIQYAIGQRFNAGETLYTPRQRKSTGVYKHRRLGYVQTYYLDTSSPHVTDINALSQKGLIAISHNFSFNKEVVVHSSIDENDMYAYKQFSIPSNRQDISCQPGDAVSTRNHSLFKPKQSLSLIELARKISTEYQAKPKQINNFDTKLAAVVNNKDEDDNDVIAKAFAGFLFHSDTNKLEQVLANKKPFGRLKTLLLESNCIYLDSKDNIRIRDIQQGVQNNGGMELEGEFHEFSQQMMPK